MREFVSDDQFIKVSFNSASIVVDYDSSMTKHTGNGNADKGNADNGNADNGNADKGNAIQKIKLY